MKIYCFSGLGADERAFQLLDTCGHEWVHVQWISPLPEESLESYARRLGVVVDTSESFILLGLSFGGMLAQEIAKEKKPERLILLSTITKQSEKPLRMRIAGKLRLYGMIPDRYFTQPSRIAHRLFGAKTEQEKHLLNQILADGDPVYIKWALRSIYLWRNEQAVESLRIHGTEDRLFPHTHLTVDHLIEGGGHLMVISHAQEVSVKICEALGQYAR